MQTCTTCNQELSDNTSMKRHQQSHACKAAANKKSVIDEGYLELLPFTYDYSDPNIIWGRFDQKYSDIYEQLKSSGDIRYELVAFSSGGGYHQHWYHFFIHPKYKGLNNYTIVNALIHELTQRMVNQGGKKPYCDKHGRGNYTLSSMLFKIYLEWMHEGTLRMQIKRRYPQLKRQWQAYKYSNVPSYISKGIQCPVCKRWLSNKSALKRHFASIICQKTALDNLNIFKPIVDYIALYSNKPYRYTASRVCSLLKELDPSYVYQLPYPKERYVFPSQHNSDTFHEICRNLLHFYPSVKEPFVTSSITNNVGIDLNTWKQKLDSLTVIDIKKLHMIATLTQSA